MIFTHSCMCTGTMLQGNTPLDVALEHGKYSAAQVLRAHGAAPK